MARGEFTPPSMGPLLPPHLTGGNTAGSPAKGFPQPVGKSRAIQNLGNYTGQRAAGLTKTPGGPQDQFNHSFGHYGKNR